jgi:hypothetical protein
MVAQAFLRGGVVLVVAALLTTVTSQQSAALRHHIWASAIVIQLASLVRRRLDHPVVVQSRRHAARRPPGRDRQWPAARPDCRSRDAPRRALRWLAWLTIAAACRVATACAYLQQDSGDCR